MALMDQEPDQKNLEIGCFFIIIGTLILIYIFVMCIYICSPVY